MTELIRVVGQTPFAPEFRVAKYRLSKHLPADEMARNALSLIKSQVKEKFSHFDGHAEQPKNVDIGHFDIANDAIEVVAFFEDREAALLWKLTHGGAC